MSTRKSNSVLRASQMLDVLAADAAQAMSLAEIARRSGMSYASAHAVAAALEEVGYVRRHARSREYTLGPALIALSTAARRSYRVVDDALPEMEKLSRELGLACTASVRDGDDMLMLAVTGPSQPFGRRVQVGERLPIAPPLGLAFIAWADQETIDAYLDRSGRRLDGPERERYRNALQLVRERGYGVVLDTTTGRLLAETAEKLLHKQTSERSRALDEILMELALEEYGLVPTDGDVDLAINALTAPVFGPDGEISIVLTLFSFASTVTMSDVQRYADRMLASARAIEVAMVPSAPHTVRDLRSRR